MDSERGAALILAMMLLSFLAILGGALLMTTTIDIWIGDNYRTGTQLLYLAEAGIERTREMLRTSAESPSRLLAVAAGPDLTLSAPSVPAMLLDTDDVPIYDGFLLTDPAGRAIGNSRVYLRNDVADGMTSAIDTNKVLSLLSIASIGSARKIVEVTVRKGGFPDPADTRLNQVAGLERIADGISQSAADTYDPRPGAAAQIHNVGSPDGYRVVVVNGDANLGPGSGYGILLIRGDLTQTGNFTWNGLILVIGQGVFHSNPGGMDAVYGGIVLAQTRVPDRSPANTLGSLRREAGSITMDFGGMGSIVQTDNAAIAAANRVFPYTSISVREH